MNVNEIFAVDVTPDKLKAFLVKNNAFEGDLSEQSITKEQIVTFLQQHKITYGINYAEIERIALEFPNVSFPLLIAEGTDSEDGQDGQITYYFDTSTEVDHSEGWDFRNVKRIPTVKVNEKLITITEPTKGTDGKTVFGTRIKARPGKPARIRPGKNVIFDDAESAFYSQTEGTVSIVNNRIHVHDVYEVNESISMKTGNIDFPGTVIIRGDVPTGFTVKAGGDINVFGLVEAATIIASGSVTISEGIAGLKQGKVVAGGDIRIGYINQGIIDAGQSIYVANSIMHSECKAKNDIVCERGNIIGGVLSVGGSIISRNVGNRMNTHTKLSFGVDSKLFDKEKALKTKQKQLKDNLNKLHIIKQKLDLNKDSLDSNMRIKLLRLTHSMEKIENELHEIEDELQTINAVMGNVEQSILRVKGTIYPNVTVAFGKYERTIEKEYDYVTIRLIDSEITIN